MGDGGHDGGGGDDGHHGPPGHDGFGSGTYGASFADVYDSWYPAGDDTDDAVQALLVLAAPGEAILELGVGTGRLALPLARAGRRVLGVDASPEMLTVLEDKLGRLGRTDPGAAALVHAVAGDITRPDEWPDGPVDVVVAAFNLVCNVTAPDEQARLFHTAADRLAPGGHLVVEAFLPVPSGDRERRLELRSVGADRVVMIASDRDAATGVVTGAHVELVDGASVRLRPWRIRPTRVEELDRWAAEAGLEVVRRDADWAGAPFDALGAGHVSVYRRPT